MTMGMIKKLKLVQLKEKAAHAVKIIKSVEKNAIRNCQMTSAETYSHLVIGVVAIFRNSPEIL